VNWLEIGGIVAKRAQASVAIVDDDADIRDMVRSVLEDAGYEVEEAADGVGALNLLRTTPHPRVMLLDWRMPHLDGVQTLRQLRREPELMKHTSVVFFTAQGNKPPPDVSELIQTTAFENLQKPFDIDVLLNTIERASRDIT
jgi:two-component system response regulator AtoC